MNREKGRDLYDLLYLLNRNTDFNASLINEKLKYYGEKYEPDKFLKKIKKWNEGKLDQDVRKFLPIRDRGVVPHIKKLLLEKLKTLAKINKSHLLQV